MSLTRCSNSPQVTHRAEAGTRRIMLGSVLYPVAHAYLMYAIWTGFGQYRLPHVMRGDEPILLRVTYDCVRLFYVWDPKSRSFRHDRPWALLTPLVPESPLVFSTAYHLLIRTALFFSLFSVTDRKPSPRNTSLMSCTTCFPTAYLCRLKRIC